MRLVDTRRPKCRQSCMWWANYGAWAWNLSDSVQYEDLGRLYRGLRSSRAVHRTRLRLNNYESLVAFGVTVGRLLL